MRSKVWIFVILLCGVSVVSACAPGICTPGVTQNCLCGDLLGKRKCNASGMAFGICQCNANADAGTDAVGRDWSEKGQPEPRSEPARDASEMSPRDEGTPIPDRVEPLQDQARDAQDAYEPGQDKPAVVCPAGEFSWEGKCHRNEDFCRGTLNSMTLPVFPKSAVAAMKEPFEIEFTPGTRRPAFCKTKEGYYYLPGSGYGKCDLDGDGWINIEAYRAVTSTDAQLNSNARCDVRRIKAIVYHAEGATPQVQMLTQEAILVETFRNDGGTDVTDLPVYTVDQQPLPKSKLSLCDAMSGCAAGESCYLGQCVRGRRFEPAEINTLTKACIGGLDLNDNQLDDATESPSDTPVPANEFKPLLRASYFIELHYARFEKAYTHRGSAISVYHIHERSRLALPGKQGLALKCQEHKDGFQPDYWKRCRLRDDQQCKVPNNPTALKPGLSHCWMDVVRRRTPSLFKCVVHDNALPQSQPAGFFHPENYGFLKKYNRPICNFKATINPTDPSRRDIAFDCTVDPGDRKPDAAKKEVGWACVSYQNYTKQADYLAGCVNESVEQVCGLQKDGEPVTYFLTEKHSYGMTRAGAPCGQSSGKGVCDKAIRICTGGSWLSCDKCDNCPQQTKAQKATCPNGVWPVGPNSCRRLQGPSPEVCDGLDNDCNGQIDEGLPTLNYYVDKDKDTYGDVTKVVKLCVGRPITGYAVRHGDCNDNDAAIKPGAKDDCDGKDNDCDGQLDEDAAVPSTTKWYKDDDQDTFGDKQGTSITGCRQGSVDATSKICTGKNTCIPLSYNVNGTSRVYVSNNRDCCDKDKKVRPNQTSFFTAASLACGTSSRPFWDYNCDGKDTPDPSIHLCSCSTRSYFREWGITRCYQPCYSQGRTWGNYSALCYGGSSAYPCIRPSNNATQKCLITTVHSFTPNPTNDFSGTCDGNYSHQGCRGPQQLSCSTIDVLSWSSSRYTAKTSGGASLLPIAKSSFGNSSTCYFRADGTLPGCGSTTSKVDKNSATATPYYKKERDVCRSNQTMCRVNNRDVKWLKRCNIFHEVAYSPDYFYFGQLSITPGKTVGCR